MSSLGKFYEKTRAQYEALTPAAGCFYKVTNLDGSVDLYLADKKLNNEATRTAATVTVADTGSKYDLGTGVEKNVENILAKIADDLGTTGDDAIIRMVTETGNNVVDEHNLYEISIYQGLANPATATASEKAEHLIGTINIAKDMVATSGTLVVATVSDPVPAGPNGADVTEGVFIEMTIANGDPFYIDVADLIVYNSFTNKAPNNAQGIVEEIYVTDSDHVITLTVGKISGTKIVYQAAVAGVGSVGDPDYVAPVAEETVNAAISRVDGKVDSAQSDLDDLEALVGTGYGTKVVSGETVNKTVKEYIDESAATSFMWVDGD